MKRMIFVLSFLLFATAISQGQEYKLLKPTPNFILINSLDSTKQIKLESSAAMDIFYNIPFTDTLIQYNRVLATGFISSINDTSINLITATEETHLKLKKNNYVITKNFYLSKRTENFDEIGPEKSIKISEIEKVRYRSPKKQNITKIGWGIYAVASITSVTSAIVAIRQDDKKAGNVLFGSVATILCVAVPVLVIGKKKPYKITEKHSKQETDYWYIGSR